MQFLESKIQVFWDSIQICFPKQYCQWGPTVQMLEALEGIPIQTTAVFQQILWETENSIPFLPKARET